MINSTSISQAYYAIQNLWDETRTKEWQLAVWVSPYENLEILNSYIGIEETIHGKAPEIFFSLRSSFLGDEKRYEESLWDEFKMWFQDVEDPKYDMLQALVADGLMEERFALATHLPKTLSSLLSEIERFRGLLKVEGLLFVINFLPSEISYGYNLWIEKLLTLSKPYTALRFVTIDIKEKRKLQDFDKESRPRIVEIDCSSIKGVKALGAAISEEIKGDNPHSPEAEYKMLLVEMLQALPHKEQVSAYFPKLLQKAEQIGNNDLIVSSYIAIAHALNSLREPKEGLVQIEKAIELSVQEKETTDWYPLWRSCLLFKASFYLALKERQRAFEVYEQLATQATIERDHLYIMEAYRLCAHVKYDSKDYKEAFEYAMLALYAGAHFDEVFRRQSTFLTAAQLAIQTVNHTNKSGEKRETLELLLRSWIGEDWEERIDPSKLGNQLLLEHYPSDLEIEGVIPSES